jgi:hypothetical protein
MLELLVDFLVLQDLLQFYYKQMVEQEVIVLQLMEIIMVVLVEQ